VEHLDRKCSAVDAECKRTIRCVEPGGPLGFELGWRYAALRGATVGDVRLFITNALPKLAFRRGTTAAKSSAREGEDRLCVGRSSARRQPILESRPMRTRSFIALATIAAGAGPTGCQTAANGTDVNPCGALASAECTKIHDCSPGLSPFFGQLTCAAYFESQCRLSLSAPGTGLSSSLVVQCVQALKTSTCDQGLFSNDLRPLSPSCQPRGGAVQNGQGCGDDWQCASGHCDVADGALCGTCSEVLAKGAPCTPADTCEDGSLCSAAGTCDPPTAVGGDCTTSFPCAWGSYCDALSGRTPTLCTTFSDAGGSCAPNRPCDSVAGLACNPVTATCEASAGTVEPGAACGWVRGHYLGCDGQCNNLDPTSGAGTCQAIARLANGQSCTPIDNCPVGSRCAAGVCTAVDPAFCVGPDAGAALQGTVTLDLDAAPSFPGAYTLTGTIHLSAPVPRGTRAGLGLTDANSGTSSVDYPSEAENRTLGETTDTLPYTIRNLAAGSYFISAYVVLGASSRIDAGDLAGYYGGTAAAPVFFTTAATMVTVAASQSGLDFGIGPVQCLGRAGDACMADQDCRGTRCVYSNGGASTAQSGVCSAATHTCASLVGTTTCAPLSDGTMGTPEEASCFGGP